MVEKKSLFFIGYLSAFLSVYLMFIAYSIIPTAFNLGIKWEEGSNTNSFVYVANATMSGNANVSSWLPLIAIVISASVVVGVLTSAFSFNVGMKETR